MRAPWYGSLSDLRVNIFYESATGLEEQHKTAASIASVKNKNRTQCRQCHYIFLWFILIPKSDNCCTLQMLACFDGEPSFVAFFFFFFFLVL